MTEEWCCTRCGAHGKVRYVKREAERLTRLLWDAHRKMSPGCLTPTEDARFLANVEPLSDEAYAAAAARAATPTRAAQTPAGEEAT